MGYIIGILLFLALLFFLLFAVGLCIFLGGLVGAVTSYIRAGITYIASVSDEVSNPFMRNLMRVATIMIVIVPACVIAFGILMAIISSF